MSPAVKAAIPMAAGLAVLFGLLRLQSPRSTEPALTRAAKRSRMPEIALRDINGKPWRLAEHRGEVVLVNFWATWCPPCREETPGLVHLANANQGRNLAVVGISMDEGGAAVVREFMTEYRMPYAVLLPGAGFEMRNRIDSLPTSVLIDEAGRVAKTYVGAISESTFQRDIDRLLAEGG